MQLTADFILDQLASYCPFVRGDSVKILCPFHEDTSPSCHVNLNENKVPIGVFHCFSCGASGSWNKLAAQLGLQQVKQKTTSIDTFSFFKRKFATICKIEDSSTLYELPDGIYNWKEPWRGLNPDFLSIFQPAKYFDKNWKEWRILFPITHFRKLVGHLSEKIGETSSPKHLFSKNFPSSKLLYPSDLHEGSSVVLVEGLVDMLRLRRDGIPALCFFGTGNWKSDKQSILLNKGITKVIACGDGDEPGWKINKVIAKDLARVFDVNVFNIPLKSDILRTYGRAQLEAYVKKHNLSIICNKFSTSTLLNKIAEIIDVKKWDPGNMPHFFIKQLKKLL